MALKNIVCFGGGNAVPKAIISPLKSYPVNITSVASMVDNGGSAGQLRRDFNVLPPGDIRRHILALSEAPEWKKELWNFRFGREAFGGGHKGHNFANVFIAGLERATKDYGKVLEIVHEFMQAKGKALPATIEKTHLCAQLENGRIIKGEGEIDVCKGRDPHIKIRRVYLEPEASAYPPVLEAIGKADLITIGPGDLYSSSIPCLLPAGMSEALKSAKAKKAFICNTMTKLGETGDFTVSDFAKEIEKYLGCALDFVIYNSEIPKKERLESCKKGGDMLLEPVKFDDALSQNHKFIATKILADKGPLVYNPEKLAKLIYSLIS